jgi:hypothetical protein
MKMVLLIPYITKVVRPRKTRSFSARKVIRGLRDPGLEDFRLRRAEKYGGRRPTGARLVLIAPNGSMPSLGS